MEAVLLTHVSAQGSGRSHQGSGRSFFSFLGAGMWGLEGRLKVRRAVGWEKMA